MEKRAKFFLIIILAATAALSGLSIWLFNKSDSGYILHARMPEDGGWSQDNFTIAAGQPLDLKIVSDDVVHGFAVGQQPSPDIELIPGVIENVSLTFQNPGTYVFYCTRWCGPNHWRMRGKIEVTGDAISSAVMTPPLFIRQNLDIDAEHQDSVVPDHIPHVISEPANLNLLPEWAKDDEQIWLQSPGETFNRLLSDPETKENDTEKLWDLTAQIYYQQTSPEGLIESQSIYAQQCAACHGEMGRGDGVIVKDLVEASEHGTNGHERQRPPDFTNAGDMLAASPAILEGKIIRGGMGTGMPYWGNIYTTQQIHDLVIYIYTFSLLQEVKP